jgi:hypothetical protein
MAKKIPVTIKNIFSCKFLMSQLLRSLVVNTQSHHESLVVNTHSHHEYNSEARISDDQ